MIQRIQTIYLALASFFGFMMMNGPIIKLFDPAGAEIKLTWKGLFGESLYGVDKLIERSIPLSLLIIAVPSLFFIAIFLFKRRKLQLRVAVLSTLLSIGVMLLVLYYIWYAVVKLDSEYIFNIRLIFPVVGAILGYLAFRGILKDELLIKSYDRLR
jgi:drug/metabolite transporter (DMT)-like permease